MRYLLVWFLMTPTGEVELNVAKHLFDSAQECREDAPAVRKQLEVPEAARFECRPV